MATGHFDYINSKRIPYPNREYVESFDNLVGGINTLAEPFDLKSNEAALMQNMTWRNGSLVSRRGQVEEAKLTLGVNEEVITCADFLFHGWMLIQSDDKFHFYKLQLTGEATTEKTVGTTAVFSFVPQPDTPGKFFRYRENVYFKSKGYYLYFTWNSSTDVLTGHQIADPFAGGMGFVPTIQIDTIPATGAGNLYQEENRLSPFKTVVYVPTPAGTTEFHLPVQNIDEDAYSQTVKVSVDGVAQQTTAYTVNYATGVITFNNAPNADTTVSITYSKQNPDAYGTLMDAEAVIVFGGAQDLCVVMGGPDGQPNSYFWSGNDGVVMNPTYFPINQYNLAGDNSDPITCFGRQQNMLVIFQPYETGRAVFGTETINGYVQVTMNYTRINDKIGCDLPGTLQLVENNLVWCNQRYGVCRLKDSSAAYENNITVISRKIHNGRYESFTGLFSHFKYLGNPNRARSADTGTRYLLNLGTWIYEWNYEISTYENPSWFIHKGIAGVGFLTLENDTIYEVTKDGVIAEFKNVYYDQVNYKDGELQTESIKKFYVFPPRNFGSYDRLKNIMSAIFTTRADSDQNTTVRYICDYAERADPTNLVVTHTEERWERPFASVFRRKPGYHNVRHLQIRLYNDEVGKDLSIVSAQIFYTLRGRQR